MDQGLGSEGKALPHLLERTSLGDRAAFRALYEATAPKLFGIVLRISRNRGIAEEILQEVYIKIWQNADRYVPEAGQPLTWLAAIARNRAIDRIRSERIDRFQDPGEDNLLERLPAPGGDDVPQRESLRSCLAELEAEARSCVVLAYCFGYSREELAAKFGRPVGTIKTLLHRSMKLLRNCLERA